jgi:hypothetical protein
MLAVALGTAAAGALAGGLSTWQSIEREKAALSQQKDSAWMQYLFGKQYSDAQFGIQKRESLEQLGVQQRNLDTQLGLSIDDYNTALLAQAFGIQDARIQTSSAIGAHAAAEGASGTRGSSSGEMIRSYAAQGLERDIEVQYQQNQNQLNQMITGANMTADAISRERASWMPGGYRVQAKEAQDTYNANIANLGQSNFNWQLDQINLPENQILDYFTGTFGGASSGFNLGTNIISFKNAWVGMGK